MQVSASECQPWISLCTFIFQCKWLIISFKQWKASLHYTTSCSTWPAVRATLASSQAFSSVGFLRQRQQKILRNSGSLFKFTPLILHIFKSVCHQHFWLTNTFHFTRQMPLMFTVQNPGERMVNKVFAGKSMMGKEETALMCVKITQSGTDQPKEKISCRIPES